MPTVDIKKVDAPTLKKWLHDGQEIALLDVREHGQFGRAHLFYAISTPLSKLETEVDRLVQRKSVRLVLVDEVEHLSAYAAVLLSERGYTNVHILEGGVTGWKDAGYVLFAGVNLPSKTFGELAEHTFNTPRITAHELNQKILNGEDLVVLDGRPFSEYKKMSIPTAISCPNGELPLRIGQFTERTQTTLVVNCAGRTRSIIGAQTLINLGIKNKIYALENGTQGWFLADLKLDHDMTRRNDCQIRHDSLSAQQKQAKELSQQYGVLELNHQAVQEWLKDTTRTTYLCDVRSPEEYAQGSIPGAQATPGGQLIQATDQYLGVRGARIVLFDTDGVRARTMSSWMAMMGWEVAVLSDAFALPSINAADLNDINKQYPDVKEITSAEIAQAIKEGAWVLDMRSSMEFRQQHIAMATWMIRPHLHEWLQQHPCETILMLCSDDDVMTSALLEFKRRGIRSILINKDKPQHWLESGLILESSPQRPMDAECIDYLFFVHDRHSGNKEAAMEYLTWEMNLLSQVDEQDLNSYRLPKTTNQ
jgi:rhodanese-related sulfurtransferase